MDAAFRRGETPPPLPTWKCLNSECKATITDGDDVFLEDGTPCSAGDVENEDGSPVEYVCSEDCVRHIECMSRDAADFEERAYGSPDVDEGPDYLEFERGF